MALSALVDIKHGYAFEGRFFSDEPPGDILVTPGNFAIGGGFQQGKSKYYTGPVPEEFVLRPGDLLVTMTDLSKTSDTLGYPAVVPAGLTHRYLHNQRVGKVIIKRLHEVNRRYLFYRLRAYDYRQEILAGATGTTVKHTSPSRIGRFRLPLPTPHEQNAIASVLGTLDDKIALNRRMNDTLEAIARALFKSWFVDFDPVRAKSEGRDPGLPQHVADLFPDSFVDSELGEIPNGWRVGQLGDVAEHPRRGVQPAAIHASTPYIALEHMPMRSIALVDWGVADRVGSSKFEFRRGEILFGKLRPYFHKVGVAPLDGVCSTDIVVLRPRQEDGFGFVLAHTTSDAFVEYATAGSTGTKMPRTSWSDMARYPLVLPPDPIHRTFTAQIRPSVTRLLVAIHESRTLAALRDTLLPKLISGELRVKDAARFLETAT